VKGSNKVCQVKGSNKVCQVKGSNTVCQVKGSNTVCQVKGSNKVCQVKGSNTVCQVILIWYHLQIIIINDMDIFDDIMPVICRLKFTHVCIPNMIPY